MVVKKIYWLSEIKKWNKKVFAEIYDSYINDVYRFISFRIDTKNDIEDIVSQVFYKAFCSLDSLNHNNFLAWLYTISRTTIIDFYKKKWTLTLEEELIFRKEKSMIERVNTIALSNIIREYIKTLWNDMIKLFDMRHTLWYSYKEISYINWKSESTNKKTYSRLVKDLQNRFWKLFSYFFILFISFLWA